MDTKRKPSIGLGFIAVEEDAPSILKVLHRRAEKNWRESADELLRWSRTLEQHGLTFEAWKRINS